MWKRSLSASQRSSAHRGPNADLRHQITWNLVRRNSSRSLHRIVLAMLAAVLAALSVLYARRQNSAANRSTASFLSEPGPTFRIADNKLHSPTVVIAYGDMRFTDPANTSATNPRVRQWLVKRIAEESPDAVLLNGDVPLAGGVKNDYEVYRSETQCWTGAHLNVFPALG